MFGLDVAFRPAAGGVDELILIDNPLDVVFFQQNGLPNVAMMSSATKAPTKQDWEVLGDLGVQNVTLALSDDTSGMPARANRCSTPATRGACRTRSHCRLAHSKRATARATTLARTASHG